MKSSTTAGLAVLAGAALFEAALVPGLVIGGALVLAPKVLLRKRPQRRPQATAAPVKPVAAGPQAEPARYDVKQAILKTITFRMIATSLDFTANMVVIGDFTTAASLSVVGMIGAPIYYFGHEVFWNRLAPAGTKVDVGTLLSRKATPVAGSGRGLSINRALAKTITYEVLAVSVDFTANYIATGDVAAATTLTAFALAVSPFVYYGHEKLWDTFGPRRAAPALGQTSGLQPVTP